VGDLALRWRIRLPAPVGDPVVSGGLVYVAVGKTKPRLDARDVKTGKYVWSALTGPGGEAPLVDGAAVLRESGTGALRRYDSRTGRILWRKDVGDIFPVQPQIATAGVWYQSDYEVVHAFDDRTGTQVWRTDMKSFRSVPAWLGGRLYVAGSTEGPNATDTGHLYQLDAATGHILWSAHGRGDFANVASPIIAGGRIVVVARDRNGTVFANAFSARDGHTLWITQLGRSRDVLLEPNAAAGDGIVAFPTPDFVLHALDQRTGRQRWSATAAGTGSPAIGNGLVWIVDVDGQLTAFSAASGQVVWDSRETNLVGSPIIADGLVLVPSSDGLAAYGLPSKG
jgi:outer membrane protein assembly factor BamB